MRIAVIGHVEHVTLGRVPALPGRGDIAHLQEPRWLPGGGGGIAFFQLVRSPAEVHLYTALGDDEAAAQVAARLARTGARVHAARRAAAHTRDLVLNALRERTILASGIVVGEPLHPIRADALPWDALADRDAPYFTAQDPAALRAARAARLLVVTTRRRAALLASGVTADALVGSAHDPRETGSRADFPARALVMTEGPAGGTVATADATARFPAPPAAPAGGGAYGAGDSFAGALTFYLALGMSLLEACGRAGRHGAAVLAALDPLDAQLALPAG